MKNLLRVEIISRQTVASFPLHIRPIFFPHAILAAIIVVASVTDFIFEMMALAGL